MRTGKLKIEYRSLETATREPETFKTQQVAALAAGKQNKMWNYIELFYHEQGEEDSGYVTESYLQRPGRTGARPERRQVERSDRNEPGARQPDRQPTPRPPTRPASPARPSFLIGKTGGALQKFEYSSLTDPTSFNQAIEKLLKG